MEINLDRNTLPAHDQPVKFRKVGETEWLEGVFFAEGEDIFHLDAGGHVGAWEVEEWEPLGDNLKSEPENVQLQKHRERLGFTQAQYAERIGISRDATISDWEKGKKPVPGPVLHVIRLEKELSAYKKGRLK